MTSTTKALAPLTPITPTSEPPSPTTGKVMMDDVQTMQRDDTTSSRPRTLHKKKSSTDLREDFYRAGSHDRARTTSESSAASEPST
ncbi:hypothetical protein AAF712_008683 [Marasmius tenuissimus]|uniref:Uncharacterized protein n=1 Tax=Marasmius tenuissimus TaxID=585030 RepID=A0ABR2ZUD4_9AGAR